MTIHELPGEWKHGDRFYIGESSTVTSATYPPNDGTSLMPPPEPHRYPQVIDFNAELDSTRRRAEAAERAYRSALRELEHAKAEVVTLKRWQLLGVAGALILALCLALVRFAPSP